MVKGRRMARGKRVRSRKSVAKQDFSGKILKPSGNPQFKQEAPWNTITLHIGKLIANGATFQLNVDDVISGLTAQLGIPTIATSKFAVRLLSVKMFDLGGRGLEVRFNDFTGSTASNVLQRELATSIKWPSRMGFASTGYSYPKAISAHPVYGGYAAAIINGNVGTPIGVTSTTTTTVMFQVSILWRLLQVGTASAFSSIAALQGVSDVTSMDTSTLVSDMQNNTISGKSSDQRGTRLPGHR